MQSSPPTRPTPISPAASQYSLDLNALEMESISDVEEPKQKVERIFSEDIDGPSDFTQNMEMWMRGGRTPKGTLKGRNPAMQHLHEHNDDNDDQRRNLPDVPSKDNEDDPTESHHTTQNSPPKVSVLENTQHEDQFSSEWHAYDSTSTPALPTHRSLLQPTVEDYLSELSPARQSSIHTAQRRTSHPTGLSRVHSVSKEGDLTPGRPSSPTLSPVRSPIMHHSSSAKELTHRDAHQSLEVELELTKLRDKCQKLEHLNDAMSQALEEEKRMRRQERTAHESQITQAARREKDLVDMKEAAHRHNDDFRREFGELRDQLREQERQAEDSKVGLIESEQDLRAEIKRLKEHMQVQSLEYHQERKTLQQDLELARRSQSNVEEAARAHRVEADERQDLLEADVARLELELQQAHLDETAIADMERRLKEANAECERLKLEKREIESSLKAVREQTIKSHHDHNQEISRNTNERSRAVDMASGLQRQLRDLRQQLKDGEVAHESELERLRTEQNTSSQVTARELDVVRAELEAKQNELNEAILERDEAQDALESRNSDVDALKSELADTKAINIELDAKISEKLQRRESYWKDKVEEGEKERQLMAKVLLHQWGREEAGIDSPQRYVYKYMSKESPATSPTKTRAKAVS